MYPNTKPTRKASTKDDKFNKNVDKNQAYTQDNYYFNNVEMNLLGTRYDTKHIPIEQVIVMKAII